MVSKQLLEDQGADSLKDVLKNGAGLTFAAGEGGRSGDQMVLRGFATTTDLFVDGARDIGQYNRDLFNTKKVEVLKGSSSMLFGRGSTGGVINLAGKKPYAGNGGEFGLILGTDRKLPATARQRNWFASPPATTTCSGCGPNSSRHLRRVAPSSARPPIHPAAPGAAAATVFT
ncbi:TonB-dependent receptor plug domain-containing protein [Chromobacterium phragmitis]